MYLLLKGRDRAFDWEPDYGVENQQLYGQKLPIFGITSYNWGVYNFVIFPARQLKFSTIINHHPLQRHQKMQFFSSIFKVCSINSLKTKECSKICHFIEFGGHLGFMQISCINLHKFELCHIKLIKPYIYAILIP